MKKTFRYCGYWLLTLSLAASLTLWMIIPKPELVVRVGFPPMGMPAAEYMDRTDVSTPVEPIAGARVELFDENKKFLGAQITDAKGEVHWPPQPKRFTVIATKDKQWMRIASLPGSKKFIDVLIVVPRFGQKIT